MEPKDRDALRETLESTRKQIDRAFRPDTAAKGFRGSTASTGHCAAVATIVYVLFGGEMVSTEVDGHGHWLNRISLGNRLLDVDLTGDQFGRPALQMEEAGQLYPNVRVRRPSELTDETLQRARLVAERAGIEKVVQVIDSMLR